MGNAAVLYDNLADIGTVTASSWIAAAPPATVQNAHVSRRWKGSNGSAEHLLLTWDSEQLVDTIALLGLAVIAADGGERTMSETASCRLRLSSADLTGLAGDVYDSGTVSGGIRAAYGALVELLAVPVAARAVRIDLAEAGVEAVMAGRLVAGLRSVFAVNFSYGWSFGYLDLSCKSRSAGGLTFVDRQDRYRVLDLRFESLAPADRYAHVYEMDRLNGISRDVLFVTDVDSMQLDRDSIWGLIQDTSPPSQANMAFWSKAYRIEERR